MSRAARLGAFIVVTLAILVAGVFIIGSKQYLFSSTYQVKAQFSNVAGLDAGADVRVGGVHSGTVHSIELPHKTGDKVTVTMDLSKSTHEIIKQDSMATIETEGMLGNQFMAISFGSAGSPNVRDGDMLASQQPLEMADLLRKASDILDSSQQAIQNATLATASLDSISAKIDHGEGTVGALVNDRQLYTNLQQTTGALRETMVQAQAGVIGFHEDMEALKHNFLLRGYFKSRGYEDSADLSKNEIERMPPGTPVKEFTYSSKQLFDKQDSAKLKNQKSLRAGGEFLAANQFGFAVVVVSAGKEGDAQKEMVLTEARAMVVREYLVASFGFDDSHLKTLGIGKQADTNSDGDWGTVRILIYPEGAEIPRTKVSPVAISSSAVSGRPSQAFSGDEPKARD
jgi:phospholipid/cholesterol/gamma-HCH transport system substrate-binding protein